MAVDPKYVETVTEKKPDDFKNILEEFGIEASFEKTGNGLDLSEYTQTYLREMYNGDYCTGNPIITDIYTVEFTNKNTGETEINHKIDLVLLDDSYEDEKEAFIFQINVNSENIDFEKNIVKNVSSSSGLYALAMGLMELEEKGISHFFNKLDIVPIKALQKKCEAYSNMTVKVVEKSFRRKGEEQFYNSFRITEAE